MLLIALQSIQLSSIADSALWQLDPTGLFTVKLFYRFLNSGGICFSLSRTVWSLKIPLKNKLLSWLAI
jgi:hypothetical protein